MLIDEYQDTNHAQYRIATCSPRSTTTSAWSATPTSRIYAWRGADIRNILEFERDYPDADGHPPGAELPQHAAILDVANAVIAHNRRRKGKNLWTRAGQGALVQVVEVNDERAEAQFVASEVQRLLEGEAGADQALPAGRDRRALPHQRPVRVLEEQFGRYAIAYQVIGGPSSTSAPRSATLSPTSR